MKAAHSDGAQLEKNCRFSTFSKDETLKYNAVFRFTIFTIKKADEQIKEAQF